MSKLKDEAGHYIILRSESRACQPLAAYIFKQDKISCTLLQNFHHRTTWAGEGSTASIKAKEDKSDEGRTIGEKAPQQRLLTLIDDTKTKDTLPTHLVVGEGSAARRFEGEDFEEDKTSRLQKLVKSIQNTKDKCHPHVLLPRLPKLVWRFWREFWPILCLGRCTTALKRIGIEFWPGSILKALASRFPFIFKVQHQSKTHKTDFFSCVSELAFFVGEGRGTRRFEGEDIKEDKTHLLRWQEHVKTMV
ncbi:hypothetical protein JOM56_010355 [Amanita muscaria]